MAETTIYPVSAFPAGGACSLTCFDPPPTFCPETITPFYVMFGDSLAGSGNELRVSAHDINNNFALVPDSPPLAKQPTQSALVYGLTYNQAGTQLIAVHYEDGGVTGWNTLSWDKLNIPALPCDGSTSTSYPHYGSFNADETQFLVAYVQTICVGPSYNSWYQLYNISSTGKWTLAPAMDLLFGGDATHPESAAYSFHFAYSPDGRFVAIPYRAGNGELRVYSASDYATIYELQGQPDTTPTNPGFGAYGAAWYPGVVSRYIAFTYKENGANGNGIAVFEVNQTNPDPPNIWPRVNIGTNISPIGTQFDRFMCSFSPDGKYFVTTSNTSPHVYVYDVTNFNDWQPVTLPSYPNDDCRFSVWDRNSEYLVVTKPGGVVPHAYIYEVNNNWARINQTDLDQDTLAWYAAAVPDDQ